SGPQPVDDYDLASRLSYFLWSSMPDAELFRLAAAQKLHEPAVLEQQARRMMSDPKARTFTENFVSQWLRTKELHTTVAPAADKPRAARQMGDGGDSRHAATATARRREYTSRGTPRRG